MLLNIQSTGQPPLHTVTQPQMSVTIENPWSGGRRSPAATAGQSWDRQGLRMGPSRQAPGLEEDEDRIQQRGQNHRRIKGLSW